MAVVDCFVNIFRCNEQTASKSWPVLLRLEKDRFSTLEGLKTHFKERLKDAAKEQGVENFVCTFYLVLKDTNRKEKYEIESNLDWKEYLPFLLEDNRFALRINVMATGKVSAGGARVEVNGISVQEMTKGKEKIVQQPANTVQLREVPRPAGKVFSDTPNKVEVNMTTKKVVTYPTKGHVSVSSPSEKKTSQMPSPFKITSTSSKPDASVFETTPWQLEASKTNCSTSPDKCVKSISIATASKKIPPERQTNPVQGSQEEDLKSEKLNILYNFKKSQPLETQEEPLKRQTASPRQIRRSLRRKTIGGKPDQSRKEEARKQVHHGIEKLMINIKK